MPKRYANKVEMMLQKSRRARLSLENESQAICEIIGMMHESKVNILAKPCIRSTSFHNTVKTASLRAA